MSGKAVIRATQVTHPGPGRACGRRGDAAERAAAPLVDPRAAPAAPSDRARALAVARRPPAGRQALGGPAGRLHAAANPPAACPRRLDRSQMFTKTGQASKVSVAKEIIIGASMGAVLGFWWQT